MKIKNLLRKLSMSTPNKMWPVYQKALEYKGLSEIKGPQHNPKILEMFDYNLLLLKDIYAEI